MMVFLWRLSNTKGRASPACLVSNGQLDVSLAPFLVLQGRHTPHCYIKIDSKAFISAKGFWGSSPLNSVDERPPKSFTIRIPVILVE